MTRCIGKGVKRNSVVQIEDIRELLDQEDGDTDDKNSLAVNKTQNAPNFESAAKKLSKASKENNASPLPDLLSSSEEDPEEERDSLEELSNFSKKRAQYDVSTHDKEEPLILFERKESSGPPVDASGQLLMKKKRCMSEQIPQAKTGSSILSFLKSRRAKDKGSSRLSSSKHIDLEGK